MGGLILLIQILHNVDSSSLSKEQHNHLLVVLCHKLCVQFVPNLPLNSGVSADVLFGVEARSLRVYNRHDKTRSFKGSTGAHGQYITQAGTIEFALINARVEGVRMRRQ